MKYYRQLYESIVSKHNNTKKQLVLAYLLAHNEYESGNTWLLDNSPFKAITYKPDGELILYMLPSKDTDLKNTQYNIEATIKIIS